MRRVLLALAAAAAILVSGCASVPMASADADKQAKSYATSPTKANLYIYRNESMGGAIRMTVSVNNKVLGQSGPKTYFLVQVDPGKHEISSLTENTSTLVVDAQAGRNYFIWQEVKMGAFSARSQLQIVDEATGRKGVDECTRAQGNL